MQLTGIFLSRALSLAFLFKINKHLLDFVSATEERYYRFHFQKVHLILPPEHHTGLRCLKNGD